MLTVCIALTGVIGGAYLLLLAALEPRRTLHGLVTSALLACAQIVMTALLLGLAHHLTVALLATINACISIGVVVAAVQKSRQTLPTLVQNTVRANHAAIANALDGYSATLLLLAVLAYGWVLLAAYYLPPRNIDDLTYHLPSIYQYIQSGRIDLLPLDMRPHFAFPENAELLFLWPTIFTHSQRWVDAANVPFVALSILAIFALLRRFDLPVRESLFAALLYAFCPVVLMQAGTNYIEIITSLFLYFSIYFAVSYAEDGHGLDLYAAGIAIGLLCGMKYTGVLLMLPLQLLIVPRIMRDGRRDAVVYLLLIILTGGWWYLRNAVVLGDPFFTFMAFTEAPSDVGKRLGSGMIANIRYNLEYWFVRYPIMDAGIGSYNGGFGLVFWGLCFFSWCYCTIRFLLLRTATLSRMLLLSYLPIGFLMLQSLSHREIDFAGRYAMFVVAVGLYALCEIFLIVRDKFTLSFIKILAIILSVFSLSLISVSTEPPYGIGDALSDSMRQRDPSEFKYLDHAHALHHVLKPAWEALDAITRDRDGGVNCMIASDAVLYSPSSVYGSLLQNRVLNLGPGDARVDAWVCTFLNKDRLDLALPDAVRRRGVGTISEVLLLDEYYPVVLADSCSLTLHRSALQDLRKRRGLQAYYESAATDAVTAAAAFDAKLDPTMPIIATDALGYGFLHADLLAGRAIRTHLVYDRLVDRLAAKRRYARCYTMERPLRGYLSRQIAHVSYAGRDVAIYLNWRS